MTEVAYLLEQLLAPVPGGTGRYSYELARALAEAGHALAGWTAWHRDVSAARVPGVAGPERLPLGRRLLSRAWERGVGPVPGGAAKVVHAPTLLVPPRQPRRGLVVTIHDAVPWTHPETLTPRGVLFHRRMGARAARQADLVLVDSATVAAELAPILRLGDRVRVVPLGATPALAAPPPDAAARLARLGLAEGGYLLTLATLEPRKGLDVAIRALAGSPLPLVVAGPAGWGGVDPAAEAARAGLPAGRVRAVGRLAEADLAAVLHGAAALVAPSRAEGFGLPVLEAMAAGVPVVVSSAPALVELVGDAGLVTPVGDASALAEAARAVVEDGPLRARLAAAGRARAAGFTWRSAADLAGAAYAEVEQHYD